MIGTTTAPCNIEARATGWGAACGSLAGATVGSFVFPILGTAVGGVVGALVGTGFGLVNGLVFAGPARHVGRGGSRAVAALTSAVCGLIVFAAVPPKGETDLWLLDLGFVVACAAIGALTGPAAMFGPERGPSGARPRREPAALVGNGVWIGAAGGATVGAAGGLAVGLFSYPPTAFFALIEGGAFGAPVGAVLGMLVAAGIVVVTSRMKT